jgi:DNA relaxase NicK
MGNPTKSAKAVIHNSFVPPVSDTGVEMTTVGLGWLKGTIRGTDPEVALEVLRPFFGAAEDAAGGTQWYRRKVRLAERSVVVAWDGVGNAGGTVLVDVTQTALDALGWERSLDLASALRDAGLRASRVDLYVDDRRRLADARTVREAVKAGRYSSHAQPGGYLEDDRTGGATSYLGSRDSERMLRTYDKDPNGEDPRTRWELESKGETARVAVMLMLAARGAASGAPSFVVGWLRAFVEFVDREPGERGDRAPLTGWWAALVEDAAAVKGTVARRVDSLARRVRWITAQVGPTLAAIWARPEYGNTWLNDVLADGLDRAGGLAWARA